MSKFNQILTIILAIQIALAVFVFWPQAPVQGAGGQLLPDFNANDVTFLTISDSDDNQITLVRRGDGWVLPNAGDYPADGEKILPLLEKIVGVQTNRLVTRTEASHKRLKVAGDDFNRLLEMTWQNGRNYQLYLGSSAGAGATHVRVDDQPEVYLTGELTSFEATTQASAWIDTLYYTLPQTSTVGLTLENENGTFSFVKDGDKWTMQDLTDDETLNESAVAGLLNQAASVRMTVPVGKADQPSFGLDQPLAVVTLQTQEGDEAKTYTLRVGAKDDANSYIVSFSGSPYYVRVAEFTGNNFINKTRADFLEAIPTLKADETNPDTSQSE